MATSERAAEFGASFSVLREKLGRVEHGGEVEARQLEESEVRPAQRVTENLPNREHSVEQIETAGRAGNREPIPVPMVPERGLSLSLWRFAERLAVSEHSEDHRDNISEQLRARETVTTIIHRIEAIAARVIRRMVLSVLRLLLVKYSEAFNVLLDTTRR